MPTVIYVRDFITATEAGIPFMIQVSKRKLLARL
jgi:hypothetical protein